MVETVSEDEFERAEEWLAPLFGQFTRDVKRLWSLLNLTINGVQAISQMPRMIDAIVGLERSRGIAGNRDGVERVEAEAALAKSEIEEGFPLTRAQFIIALWAMLEAIIRTFVARWLEHEGIERYEAVRKLRVRVGDYQAAGEQRFYFLVQMLEREEASSLKSGSDRFESLLHCVGMGGALPRMLKRSLFELSQLRNCAVHNGMRADDALLKACPWLGFSKGNLIRLEGESAYVLFRAVMDYSALVLMRASAAKGRPMQTTTDDIVRDWTDEQAG